MKKMIMALSMLALALVPYPSVPSFAGHENGQGDQQQSEHAHKHKPNKHHKHHKGD